MYLFTLFPKQAGILVPFLLFLPLNLLATEFERQGNPSPCCVGSCDDEDDSGNEEPHLGRPDK